MAMIAKRLGYSVVLLEKRQHPRVVIGESSTPLSNLLLETLADRYDLPLIKPFCRWGTWQQTYPQIACGLKRGFTFFHHELGRETNFTTRDHHLLVAASPFDSIADTHWYRADFDELLVRQAQELGVDFFDRAQIEVKLQEVDRWYLSVIRDNVAFELEVGFLIDATGPRGFLHRAFGLEDKQFHALPKTSALYSHFSGVNEFAPSIGHTLPDPPYPPDAAALHHVFDGGWIWVLRFNNGITSAGIAASPQFAEKFALQEGEEAWQRVLDNLPLVKQQFANAKVEMPFRYLPQLPFLSSEVAGSNWALLPSAAGFVDPLLSTGFPLTLLGVSRLAKILEETRGSSDIALSLSRYALQTTSELEASADLIGALYANLHDFELFRTLALLYFAAASYSETARRLDRPELADSFLLCGDPVFGPRSMRLLQLARQPLTHEARQSLIQGIYELVREFDVAGLVKRPANYCYPVRAEDLYESAAKVGASRTEIDNLLVRSGFYPTVN